MRNTTGVHVKVDKDVYSKFKIFCVLKGKSVGRMIEKLMKQESKGIEVKMA